MQPITNSESKSNSGKNIGMESVSFLTISGVIALSVFGFELSVFNGLLLGLLSAFFLTGLSNAIFLTLKGLGLLLIFLYTADKLVQFSLHFIEQVILFFELRESLPLKDGLAAAFFLPFFKNKY